jgi:hypothetical protein
MNYLEIEEAVDSKIITHETILWASGFEVGGLHNRTKDTPPTEVRYVIESKKHYSVDRHAFERVTDHVLIHLNQFADHSGPINVFFTKEEATQFYVQECKAALKLVQQAISNHVKLHDTTEREILKYSWNV